MLSDRPILAINIEYQFGAIKGTRIGRHRPGRHRLGKNGQRRQQRRRDFHPFHGRPHQYLLRVNLNGIIADGRPAPKGPCGRGTLIGDRASALMAGGNRDR